MYNYNTNTDITIEGDFKYGKNLITNVGKYMFN